LGCLQASGTREIYFQKKICDNSGDDAENERDAHEVKVGDSEVSTDDTHPSKINSDIRQTNNEQEGVKHFGSLCEERLLHHSIKWIEDI
jgi:hypothetical protein